MTQPHPQPHCGHECVCHDMTNNIGDIDNPCNNLYCSHDTRTNAISGATSPLSYPLGDCLALCKKAREDARKAEREQVLELLEDFRKYSNGEYNEAYLSDNEREMRIHNDYGCKIWGIMQSLRGGA